MQVEEQKEGNTDSVVGSKKWKSFQKHMMPPPKDKLLLMVKQENSIEECTFDELNNSVLNKGLEYDLNWFNLPAEWKTILPNFANKQPEFASVDNL